MSLQRFVFVAAIMLVFMALAVKAQVEAPTPTPGGPNSDNSIASPKGLISFQQMLLGFLSIGMSFFLFVLKDRV